MTRGAGDELRHHRESRNDGPEFLEVANELLDASRRAFRVRLGECLRGDDDVLRVTGSRSEQRDRIERLLTAFFGQKRNRTGRCLAGVCAQGGERLEVGEQFSTALVVSEAP